MQIINVLVFPCGSEIALELMRSVKFSRHIKLFGASSVEDHGSFEYENYIGGMPFIDSINFIEDLNKIIEKYQIDAIYPAMDSVIALLSANKHLLRCKLIGSSDYVNQICLSKLKTYEALNSVVHCPAVYKRNEVDEELFPLFLKPDVGYGSRGVLKVDNFVSLDNHLALHQDCLILEYLPGEEITVDCFSDKEGVLRFYGPRRRGRVANGISVGTEIVVRDLEQIKDIAIAINEKLHFRGAWFFQMKYDVNSELCLLEVAARFGGSSSLNRCRGVNFGLLSIFDAFNFDVDIVVNSYNIVLDRALDNKYKIALNYRFVYCDFDDCLVIEGKVNTQLLRFLYQCLNDRKILILITKHVHDIDVSLKKYRLNNLFDEVIHLDREDSKSNFINNENSIFIDDSFMERQQVFVSRGIPVFSPDMIESLIH
ncbi:ATP-grasp domain-containing protein [Sphingobacterium griseoflavum]|uniref:Carbamoylphosphate synthase large subunit short form n=1 Tax=Sphingobacterium griseoflavum TaxID=1474952 RepID=A0ABQ3HZK4_9SPHI|nr:ATP-grasp domain-containing protein [Sphingobacterium griseoflavum]GHE39728.1 carbamoylphosphate synthase large subunit short form [Sphingobacterium griseoflavum]